MLVAVAGGTSPTLGRSIIQAILATGKHEVTVLSRVKLAAPTEGPTSKYGARIQHVDYDSSKSLTEALRGVNTLISVLKIVEPGASVKTHRNLLEACRANNVARFIMSDWGMATIAHSLVDILADRSELIRICKSENERPGSQTACSTIQVGMFMNYFAQGSPNVKADAPEDSPESRANAEITGHLHDDFMLEWIDISNRRLLCTSTLEGDYPNVSVTHLLDIGQLIAQSLELPPSAMRGPLGVVSQMIHFTEVQNVLNKDCGMDIQALSKSPEVVDVQIDELGKRFSKSIGEGGFDLKAFMERAVCQMMAVHRLGDEATVRPTLNQKLRQAGMVVKTRSVRDLLIRAWGSNEAPAKVGEERQGNL